MITGLRPHDLMLFLAEGPITSTISTDCGRTLRARTQLSVGGRILLFGAFVELAQNIARHSAERSPEENVGIGRITVNRTATGFVLRTTNLIDNADVPALRDRLASIRAIPTGELNRLYLARLHQTDPPAARSGLGLIDLHRKAASPPEIEISPASSGRSSLSINLSIDCA